jgi:hypothetical protein
MTVDWYRTASAALRHPFITQMHPRLGCIEGTALFLIPLFEEDPSTLVPGFFTTSSTSAILLALDHHLTTTSGKNYSSTGRGRGSFHRQEFSSGRKGLSVVVRLQNKRLARRRPLRQLARDSPLGKLPYKRMPNEKEREGSFITK